MRYIITALLAATVIGGGTSLVSANGKYPGDDAYAAAAHTGMQHIQRIQLAQAASNKTTGKAVPVTASSSASTAKLTATQVQTNPLLLLQQFSVADLQAALADAQAQTPPDATSIPCYTELLALVNSPINSPLPNSPGLFLALQKARDIKAFLANLQSPTGPLSSLNIACAPLMMDVNATLLALGVGTGIVAGTGGLALPALPAFGGLLTLLPK